MKTIEKLLTEINNKKLIAAYSENNTIAFHQIAVKLYEKARKTQDKKEFLLAECLKYSRNEELNINQAVNKYSDMIAQESGVKAMVDVQHSEKFLAETDSLRKYDMKETAYDDAYNSAKNEQK